MFEALIEFAEETLFSRIKLITSEEKQHSPVRMILLPVDVLRNNPGIQGY